ncbi:uncharacterized protein A4U43_C05F11580 [Asparagus officinalis]|uniref:Uncharacterized protein n=1 Tax=Asparagus officinalis TaxID=4686 RepID=A0A5P1ERZ8_ASPOF|nr:uncharacterized protein A4U43_C05F11580 [Asparagus officinalis]
MDLQYGEVIALMMRMSVRDARMDLQYGEVIALMMRMILCRWSLELLGMVWRGDSFDDEDDSLQVELGAPRYGTHDSFLDSGHGSDDRIHVTIQGEPEVIADEEVPIEEPQVEMYDLMELMEVCPEIVRQGGDCGILWLTVFNP